MEEIQLSDLQKLAVHNMTSGICLLGASEFVGSIPGVQYALQTIALAEAILGEDIVRMLNDPEKRDGITKQAFEFQKLFLPDLSDNDEDESEF